MNLSRFRSLFQFTALAVVPLCYCLSNPAHAVSVQDALKFAPVQADVDYDRPSAKEAESCTLASEKIGSVSAWVVRGPGGQVLRVFADTNGDNNVDQWSYFLNGIEVYRDIDSNFDGKADQYRWFSLGGTRWGIDKNQDGVIDHWKSISPEEVTSEVVAAIARKDVERFNRLLITPAELRALGLGAEVEKRIAKQIATAASRFQAAAAQQRLVDDRTKWIHFGANRPGVLPAGTDGSTNDVYVYENVSALVESAGNASQVGVGTLLRVGEIWRMIDVPTALMEEEARLASAYFFQPTLNKVPDLPAPPEGALNEQMQALVGRLDQFEKQLASSRDADEKAKTYEQITMILKQLAAKAGSQKDQSIWIRQMADTLLAGVQTGDYPAGVQKLNELYSELAKQYKTAEDTGYVKFRLMNAQFSLAIADPKVDYPKIQEARNEELKEFIRDYPQGRDAAEAMLQLAEAEEFFGNEDAAVQWYGEVLKIKADERVAKKAEGARRRLTGVGKPLNIQGQTTDGKRLDLGQLRGRYVLIHFWATYCEPCKDDMKKLEKLVAEYGGKFLPVGINVDSDQEAVADFLRRNRLVWPQIYEEGGLDSRLALELGIITLPTMILVDDEGKVVHRDIRIGELETYLAQNIR